MLLVPFNRTTFGIETGIGKVNINDNQTFNRTTFGIETCC